MVTFVNIKGSGWSGKIHSHCSGSPDSKQGNEITIRGLLLSFSVPEDQEESRLIGLEVLMAPLGRPRFAVLYLRGPISNPRILEQRYDTFFVMMLFYVDLSPKKLCSKHCFRRSARLGSLFSSPLSCLSLCASVSPFVPRWIFSYKNIWFMFHLFLTEEACCNDGLQTGKLGQTPSFPAISSTWFTFQQPYKLPIPLCLCFSICAAMTNSLSDL